LVGTSNLRKEFNMKYILLTAVLFLAACKASTNADMGLGPAFAADSRPLPSSTDPLAGTMDTGNWQSQTAIAQWENGEYTVTIAGQGAALTCSNPFPMAPHVVFTIPPHIGDNAYDSSSGGQRVNVIFPYTTANGGGSDNVLASKSLIHIDAIGIDRISGNVSALSSVTSSHSYQMAGSFTAVICPSR
jgi:hypothetical protein